MNYPNPWLKNIVEKTRKELTVFPASIFWTPFTILVNTDVSWDYQTKLS